MKKSDIAGIAADGGLPGGVAGEFVPLCLGQEAVEPSGAAALTPPFSP